MPTTSEQTTPATERFAAGLDSLLPRIRVFELRSHRAEHVYRARRKTSANASGDESGAIQTDFDLRQRNQLSHPVS